MSSINPLRFGIPGNNYYKKDNSDNPKHQNAKEEKSSEKKNINSNFVFDYMSAQNTDIMPASVTKAYSVSKYVSPEQEARIEDFVKSFETNYDDIVKSASNEFVELSEGAVSELALNYINNKYQEE